jgi:hypothetical protein
MLDSGSASSRTSSMVSGAMGTFGLEAAPYGTSASGTTPSIATAFGIVITQHETLVPGGYDYYMCRRHHHSLRTFYYGAFRRCGLCTLRNGLGLRKGCRLLNSWRRVFTTNRCTGFLAFPRQIS